MFYSFFSSEKVFHVAYLSAAWELMKVSGINDLRSRKYPQLTEFITLLSSNSKTHVAFNWPVTRLEGDYCENTNGYVCQRPAAAGTKVETIGKQRNLIH